MAAAVTFSSPPQLDVEGPRKTNSYDSLNSLDSALMSPELTPRDPALRQEERDSIQEIRESVRRMQTMGIAAVDDPAMRKLQRERSTAFKNRDLLHVKDGKQVMVLGMVGLPARGKTYIAHKVMAYLAWLGYKTKMFNLGTYRRATIGTEQTHEFFDPSNAEAVQMRNKLATLALNDIVAFFAEGGQVAVLDATNSTKARRAMVAQYLENCPFTGELMWIESICNDDRLIAANIRDTKLQSEDYKDKAPQVAMSDFMERIAMYMKEYETVTDDELGLTDSYIKLIDNGQRAMTNGIRGYLPSRIVFFLMNLTITQKPIYLTRHGQSEWNKDHRLGGNSPITLEGRTYATALGKFLAAQPELMRCPDKVRLWCSSLDRTIQTAELAAQAFKNHRPITKWRALSEINAGIYDGYTYEQVKDQDPQGFKERSKDKLNYKYPQGESYKDVIDRVERVIFEIERLEYPVVLVGHQAVLRCLYGYFLNIPLHQIPTLDIPLHTVIKLVPGAYSCREERFALSADPDHLEYPPHMQQDFAGPSFSVSPATPSDNSCGSHLAFPPGGRFPPVPRMTGGVPSSYDLPYLSVGGEPSEFADDDSVATHSASPLAPSPVLSVAPAPQQQQQQQQQQQSQQ